MGLLQGLSSAKPALSETPALRATSRRCRRMPSKLSAQSVRAIVYRSESITTRVTRNMRVFTESDHSAALSSNRKPRPCLRRPGTVARSHAAYAPPPHRSLVVARRLRRCGSPASALHQHRIERRQSRNQVRCCAFHTCNQGFSAIPLIMGPIIPFPRHPLRQSASSLRPRHICVQSKLKLKEPCRCTRSSIL
jgi:hypothetical protein